MKKILSRIILVMPLWLALAGHYVWLWPGAGAGLALGVLLTYAGIRAGKLPLIERKQLDGANGRNWPLYVEIDPKAAYHKAVLAQELWEAIHKTNPINLIRSRSEKGQRTMEYMGHEIEVQAAVMLYGVAEATYRKAEAERMQAGYSGIFEGQPVERELAARRDKARKWVRENRERFA